MAACTGSDASVNAARKAGEWQTVEVTLVGRVVTVTLTVTNLNRQQSWHHGRALDSEEEKPGPILLQGDHGMVEFRKLVLNAGE